MNSDERLAQIKKIVGQETMTFLVKARKNASLNLDQASRLLGYPGVSKLVDFESGKVSVPMFEMHRIVSTYGLPLTELFEYMNRVREMIHAIE